MTSDRGKLWNPCPDLSNCCVGIVDMVANIVRVGFPHRYNPREPIYFPDDSAIAMFMVGDSI